MISRVAYGDGHVIVRTGNARFIVEMVVPLLAGAACGLAWRSPPDHQYPLTTLRRNGFARGLSSSSDPLPQPFSDVGW